MNRKTADTANKASESTAGEEISKSKATPSRKRRIRKDAGDAISVNKPERFFGEEFENYEGLGRKIRDELKPEGVLERILVERIIRSAWGLARIDLEGQVTQPRTKVSEERRLVRSVIALKMLQERKSRKAWGSSSHLIHPRGLDVSFASQDQDEWAPQREEQTYDSTPLPRPRKPGEEWRDRLTFDSSVSADSPVVRGTWVTASHVVTLIVDGLSWAEILRTHPELNEEDIRACVAYTVELDGGEPKFFEVNR